MNKLRFYPILAVVLIIMTLFAARCYGEERSFFDEHEVYFGYAPWCRHLFSDNPKYNENNNHLLMLQIDQWFVMTFRNSYYDRCFAFGYTLRTPKWEPFEVDNWLDDLYVRGNMPIGLVHGYHNRNIEFAGFSPAAIPALEVGWKNFSINTTVFPVGSIMFTWRF